MAPQKPASDSTASESKQALDDLELFLKDLEFLNGDMEVKIPIYILREAKSTLESKPDTALADLKAKVGKMWAGASQTDYGDGCADCEYSRISADAYKNVLDLIESAPTKATEDAERA